MFKTNEQLDAEAKNIELQKKYKALVNQVVRWNEGLTRTIIDLEDSPNSFRKAMIGLSFSMDEVVIENGFKPYLEGSVTEGRKQKLMEEKKLSEG